MSFRWIALGLWLVACLGFVAWNATRTVFVGRMLMPREQVVAISIVMVISASLAFAWLWMGFRFFARRSFPEGPLSWVEHPAARAVLLSLLAVSALLFLYARFIEPRWVAVRHVPLGTPPTSNPIRVVVLSDLHVEGDREPWSSLASKVNATDPDIILLLGDTLNRPAAVRSLHRVLEPMRARHGKYAVRGNWDVWYWSHLPLLRGTGFTWLDRQVVTRTIRGQSIHLVGFPYRDNDDGETAERRLSTLPKDDWRVFLYHTPDLVEKVPSADVYLAGHTHGGQVSLPFFGALVTLSKYGKRFERGLSRAGNTIVYVNPGVGVEPIAPVRFGVRPEITVLEFGERLQVR